MSKGNELSVDSIIKKYQLRQQQLSRSNAKDEQDSIHTERKGNEIQHMRKSGVTTPEFNNVSNRIEKKLFKDYNYNIGRTHKKNESYETFHPKEEISQPFNNPTSQKRDFEAMLVKLDQTEQKLARSERNYAEMWRKYEQKTLKDGKKYGKQIDIQHHLRHKQVQQLNISILNLEKQNTNLKQCIKAKDSNLSALREKLKQKNQRMVENERFSESLRSEIQLLKTKQQKLDSQQDDRRYEKESLIETLQKQLAKFQILYEEKEKEKKQLLTEIQQNYINHKQQLQILRMGYTKVEEEYKEWIEQCNNEKMLSAEKYQHRIKELSNKINNNNLNGVATGHLEQQVIRQNEQISRFITQNLKLINEVKISKINVEEVTRDKDELIIKVSVLQNSMVERIESYQMLEKNYSKLQNILRTEEERYRDLSSRYNSINKEFQQLKSKCGLMFSQMQEKKYSKNNQSAQIQKLKREIQVYREKFEKSRENQMTLSSQLAQALNTLKNKKIKFDLQNEQITTDLLAQRLQNMKLKEQIKQIKNHLKKQYELSLENTRKQLQQQICRNSKRPAVAQCDVQKQHLYLQLRELERRYQLLASEVVTVDEVMGLAAKVQRRYIKK